MKKKFRDDYLQRSYDQMAETFGLSKKQATEAVKALENMGTTNVFSRQSK